MRFYKHFIDICSTKTTYNMKYKIGTLLIVCYLKFYSNINILLPSNLFNDHRDTITVNV